MMVMQAASFTSPLTHQTACSSQQSTVTIRSGEYPNQGPKSMMTRKQIQDSASSFTFPSTYSSTPSSSPPARPQFERSTSRPREAKPVVKDSPRSNQDQNGDEEFDGIEWTKEKDYGPQVLLWRAPLDRLSPGEGSDCSTLCVQTPPALATDPAHRRTRSHFSIPDVVVTSCAEEGETLHYEIKVEPTHRKMSLPTSLIMSNTNLNKTKKQASSQKDALEAASTKANKKSSRPKVKPIAIQVYQETQIMDEFQQRSFFDISPPATTNSKDAKGIKRLRKSSLPSLFTRKDREATILPPSPTIPENWQQQKGALAIIASSAPSSPLSSLFGTTPATSAPFIGSPTSPTSPLAHSSPSSARFVNKKQLQARQKEENDLIKELEKIDKMVRKHDEKAQKAAKKAVEVSAEGKAKKALRRMSVFRASPSTRQEITVTNLPALPEKTEMEIQNYRAPIDSIKSNDIVSTSPRRFGQRTSQESDRNPHVWAVDVWTDLSSNVDEPLPSLTPSSPVGKSRVLERETVSTVRSCNSRTNSIQKTGSTSKCNTTRLEGGGRRRTPTNSTESTTNKRRSFLLGSSSSMTLSLHLEDGADLGWEDAADSPEREKSDNVIDTKASSPTISDIASFSKPINLLESLYQDIEDMELNFQLERNNNSNKEQSAVIKKKEIISRLHESSPSEPSSLASSSRASTGSSSIESVTRNNIRLCLNSNGFRFPSPPGNKPSVQRADILPTSDLHRQEELPTVTTKSTSVPDFF